MILGKTRAEIRQAEQAKLEEWYFGKRKEHFPILPVVLDDGRWAWLCPVWKKLNVVKRYGQYQLGFGCKWRYTEMTKE